MCNEIRMSGIRFAPRARAFLADARGLAAVELAMILPFALMLLSLVVYGGQAYWVQRKVTLAATTVANIFAQANNNNQSTITAAELNQILAYPNLILYPYSAPAPRSKCRNCWSPSTGTGPRPARSAAAGPTPTEPPARPASNCRSIRRSLPPFPARAATTIPLAAASPPILSPPIMWSWAKCSIRSSRPEFISRSSSMTLHDSIIMIPRVASPITVQ